MSKLSKNWTIEYTPATPGDPGYPGSPAMPGYWSTEYVPGEEWDGYINVHPESSGNVRFATHYELGLMWPWLKTSCAIQKYILAQIRTTPRCGYPLHWMSNNTQYIAISAIVYGGRVGIAFVVITGKSGTQNVFDNPEYWGSSYEYNGEIPGCP